MLARSDTRAPRAADVFFSTSCALHRSGVAVQQDEGKRQVPGEGGDNLCALTDISPVYTIQQTATHTGCHTSAPPIPYYWASMHAPDGAAAVSAA
jgi:hypothetical protein